ncbi:Asp-tRNA(Asn)/Glu-tRNA(Gln) amidotransferase subunit GatC [Alphaproteobacteria bacterium]|nr:Asp-tRNA(Asn)/Glu-tRNA(Gln) amidotransferase subunit GatC [Alphaproteobacteria bacterium]|tara:strand:+ start:254 stop:541 length:288 start_codon:yes stop_codon:yes gene_type:complete
MSIDNSIVKKISKLSKLKIRSDSEDKMAEELNNILNWVESLQEVNTEEIEPLLSVLNEKMPLRDDEVVMDDNQGDILNNAPEKKSGFFVVPKVVE